MQDPSVPLQKAIYDALSAEFGAEAGVYDQVPADSAGRVTAKFPYLTIGEDLVVSDADQCHDPSTCYQTVHVWSRAVGRVEAKRLMARAVSVLDAMLVVEGFQVIAHAVDQGPQDVAGPDPLTTHRVATMAYKLGPVG